MNDTDTNPLADLRMREAIDLSDRVREVRDELLPELDDRIDAIEDPDREPAHPDDNLANLREVRKTLRGQAKACERVIELFDGEAVFVIHELMTAETALLTDDVNERSIDVDYQRQTASGAPKQGYHKTRTLELALADAPDGIPMRHDEELDGDVYQIGDLPDHVTDFLYQCATELNDSQSVAEVGNLSTFGVTPIEDSSG